MSKSANKIIINSTKLFKYKGFNASSVSDIATETGILKGSLYNHFASKEHILIAVIEALSTEFLEYITDSNIDNFEKILEKTTDYFVEEQCCLMANLLTESIPENARIKVKGFFYSWKDILVNSMDDNISLEEKDIFAEDIIALFEGSVIMIKVTGNTEAIYRSLKTLINRYRNINKSLDSLGLSNNEPEFREICKNGNDDTLICDM